MTTKNLGGRPSKYKPEYAEQVVEFCSQGFSLTAFAGEIGVGRDTIARWNRDIPEFGEGVQRAKAKMAQFWEQQAVDLAKNGGQSGRATIVIFGLRNAAPEDFSETKRVELTGADGGPLSIEGERTEDKKLLLLALEARSAVTTR